MEEVKAKVYEALKTVFDPEIGLDIVSLGLVYDVVVDPERVTVNMTLTTKGCPLGDVFIQMVQQALADKIGSRQAIVEFVWEPEWTPDMMVPEAKWKMMGGSAR